jgi:DNA-directed RNA polymerase subunit omega
MNNVYVKQALKQVKVPEVLVNMVSQRVRQLGRGFQPLVPVAPNMTFMDVALKEIAEEKLTFEYIDKETTPVVKKPKKRTRAA